MAIDWVSIGIGVVLAGLAGALAIYLSVYKTPASDKMIDFLVATAQKLLDAAVAALVKQMNKENALTAARDTFDPKPEMRKSELAEVADALHNWRKKN